MVNFINFGFNYTYCEHSVVIRLQTSEPRNLKGSNACTGSPLKVENHIYFLTGTSFDSYE